MQIYDWSINHSGREIHSCSDREKGNPIGHSGRWAIIFGHANFVDLLIAHGNWKLWNYDFLPASSTPRQHMPIAADWYVMSIVILFAGTLTFHRRDAMCCDAMPCDVIGAGGAPSSWIDLLPPGTRLPVRLHTRHACSYTNSMRLIIRSNGCSTDGSPFFFWFCALFVWPRVTSTTMTRTFKICSTDPGGAGRARWSKTHSHGPLIGTMPQYGLQINWPASIAAESPKSYLCPRPREDGILKERVALKILL